MKKIHTVKILTHSLEEGEEMSYISAFLERDKQGNIILSETYFAPNELESKIISKHDEDGNKIEEINYLSEDEISEHFFFHRDIKGKILKEELNYADGSKSIKLYLRNETEKTLTITTQDEDDNIEEIEFLKFDSNKQVIEKILHNENNKMKEKTLYEYDDSQRIRKRTEYGANETLIVERNFFHDEKGNLIKQFGVKNKKLLDSVVFQYDEKNRVVETQIANQYLIKYSYDDENHSQTEERFAPNGMLEFQQISFFNEDGLLVEEQIGELTKKYEYTFYQD